MTTPIINQIKHICVRLSIFSFFFFPGKFVLGMWIYFGKTLSNNFYYNFMPHLLCVCVCVQNIDRLSWYLVSLSYLLSLKQRKKMGEGGRNSLNKKNLAKRDGLEIYKCHQVFPQIGAKAYQISPNDLRLYCRSGVVRRRRLLDIQKPPFTLGGTSHQENTVMHPATLCGTRRCAFCGDHA